MNCLAEFIANVDQAIADAPSTANRIPLIGYEELQLKDAQAAALISALADIIESACTLPAAVPMTHADSV